MQYTILLKEGGKPQKSYKRYGITTSESYYFTWIRHTQVYKPISLDNTMLLLRIPLALPSTK